VDLPEWQGLALTCERRARTTPLNDQQSVHCRRACPSYGTQAPFVPSPSENARHLISSGHGVAPPSPSSRQATLQRLPAESAVHTNPSAQGQGSPSALPGRHALVVSPLPDDNSTHRNPDVHGSAAVHSCRHRASPSARTHSNSSVHSVPKGQGPPSPAGLEQALVEISPWHPLGQLR